MADYVLTMPAPLPRMNTLVNFFWHGPPLSIYESACIRSYVQRGFEVNMVSYDQTMPLPGGVNWIDAREFLPESEVHSYSQGGHKPSIAAFSDVMRYAVLAKLGGWWSDTDEFCLASADEFRARFGGQPLIAGFEAPGRIAIGLLYCDSDTGHAAELLRRAQSHGKTIKWGQIGPKLVTAYVREQQLEPQMAQIPEFYPIPFGEAHYTLLPQHRDWCRERVQGALAFHLWNELYRRWELPKALLPPLGSFLRERMQADQPDLQGDSMPAELIATLIKGHEARRKLEKWDRIKRVLSFGGKLK